MAKKKKEITDPQDIQVKLKKVMGFSPRIYVPAIYSILILLIVYIVFFHPGVAKGGSLVSFKALPADTSVFVDGKLVGATPCEVFVARGEREILFSKEGFNEDRNRVIIPGRVFASRFFPRKALLTARLKRNDAEGIAERAYRDYVRWTLTGELQQFYPVPQVLSAAALDLSVKGVSSEQWSHSLLEAAVKQAYHPVYMKDMIKAGLVNSGQGPVLTVGSLSSFLGEISKLVEKNPSYWNVLYQSASISSASETLIKSIKDSAIGDTTSPPPPVKPGNSVKYSGLTFFSIPEGEVALGNSGSGVMPYRRTLKAFYLQQSEVSQALFGMFLEENPQWDPESSNFSKGDYVSDEYLKHFSSESFLPVMYISYYAAEAFAAWFSETRLAGTPWKAVIPSESQWERAGRLNYDYALTDTEPGKLLTVDEYKEGMWDLKAMEGGLWEWTSGDYHALEPFFTTETASVLDSGIRAVKGGCYVNGAGEITPANRGVQPADMCTPFLGFRLALIKD